MFHNIDPYQFALSMIAVIICITIHEFAHAYSAYRAGDETPHKQGRISLNPLDHLDPMGTILMIVSSLSGYGIGWGKPVQVNPYNFRHPRWDNLWVSLWGPLSNLLTAIVVGVILRFSVHSMSQNLATFLVMIVAISVGLAVFNLLPIGPLDGSHIVSSLLPYEQARRYDMFMARYGFMLFLGIIFFAPGLLNSVLDPPRQLLIHLIIGV